MPLANKFPYHLFWCDEFNWNAILDSEKRKASLAVASKVLWCCFLRDHLMQQGDQEAKRTIESMKSKVNRKKNGIVDARRAVPSRIGTSVPTGARCEQRQTTVSNLRATLQARDNCNKKKKSRKIKNPHHVRDRCICSYHWNCTCTVSYRTLQNTAPCCILQRTY